MRHLILLAFFTLAPLSAAEATEPSRSPSVSVTAGASTAHAARARARGRTREGEEVTERIARRLSERRATPSPMASGHGGALRHL